MTSSQKTHPRTGATCRSERKADQIVSLIQQRSLWPELLRTSTSVSAPTFGSCRSPRRRKLASGWRRLEHPPRTVRSPARRGGRRGRRRSSRSASASAVRRSKTIGELHIEGAGIHSAENPERDIQLVYDFAKSLSESTNFYDKAVVVIDVPPNPMLQGQTFTFTVRAKLAKPLPI